MIGLTWQWLTDPATWTGPGGILAQSLTHLRISLIALVLAALVAVIVALVVTNGSGATLDWAIDTWNSFALWVQGLVR